MDKNNKYKAQPDPYNFKETGKFIEEYIEKPKEIKEKMKNKPDIKNN